MSYYENLYEVGSDVSDYIVSPTKHVATGIPMFMIITCKFSDFLRVKVADQLDCMDVAFAWDLRQHMFDLMWEKVKL